MLKTVTVSIEPEIESLASEQNTTVEAVVYEALSEYVRSQRKAVLRERLEEEYRVLGEMWTDLQPELDEERWLSVENEALNKTENALD
jgi:hypothetical protein